LVFGRRISYLLMLRTSLPSMESAMTFKQGVSGNPHGNRHRTRHLLNQEFMQALLLNFRHQGKKAIEKVARNQPAVYLKILALLVPREMVCSRGSRWTRGGHEHFQSRAPPRGCQYKPRRRRKRAEFENGRAPRLGA